MQIKSNIEMESFNDGLVSIYTENNNNEYQPLIVNVRYSNRIVGAKRFYAATSANTDISKLIRIPKINNINTFCVVVIDGKKYELKQIQYIDTTNPPVVDLTLRERGRFDFSKVKKE